MRRTNEKKEGKGTIGRYCVIEKGRTINKVKNPQNRGITLIALVVTIIVLLILAGITISALSNDNGIFTNAKNAKSKTAYSQAKEQAQLEATNLTAYGISNKITIELADGTSASIPTLAEEAYSDLNIQKEATSGWTEVKYDETNKSIYLKYVDSSIISGQDGVQNGMAIFQLTLNNDTMEYKGEISAESYDSMTATIVDPSVSNVTVADLEALKNKEGNSEGVKVKYSVTVNNVELKDWYLFSTDETNKTASIIYGGYLPNSTNLAAGAGLTQLTGDYVTYCVNSNNRRNLIDNISDTTKWTGLTSGISGATATGGPTLEQWINSWNSTYPEEILYTKKDGTDYFVGDTEKPNSYKIGLSGKTGYKTHNKTYFPYSSSLSNCYGYWLASPSARSFYSLVYVACYGDVRSYDFNQFSSRSSPPSFFSIV